MKTTLLYILLFFSGLVMLDACKSPAATAKESNPADTLLAGLERGPCFGQCPQYKAIIYTSGFAEFYGDRNYPRLGYYQARLSKGELTAFRDLMKKYNMADADSEYVNKRLADYPAYWLTVSGPNGSRRIHVSHEEPPSFIADYTAELESLISLLPWKEARRTNDQ